MIIDKTDICHQIKLSLHYDYNYEPEEIDNLIDLFDYKIDDFVENLEKEFAKLVRLLLIMHRKYLFDEKERSENEEDLLEI